MSLATKRTPRVVGLLVSVLTLLTIGYHFGVSQQAADFALTERRRAEAMEKIRRAPPPAPLARVEGPPATIDEMQTRALEAGIDERISRVSLGDIWMERDEVKLVLKYLHDVDTYIEWGSGGSTMNFPQFARRRAVSIEHHKEYCEGMPARLAAKKLRKVEFRCVSVNQQNWEGTYATFKPYVDEMTRLNQTVWDFVFIDGRARVSCALRSLSYISDKSIVVVHDFERLHDAGQASYLPILKYYDVVERLGETVKHGSSRRGMGVLRRKDKFRTLQGNHAEVQRILDDGTTKRLF